MFLLLLEGGGLDTVAFYCANVPLRNKRRGAEGKGVACCINILHMKDNQQ